MKRKFCPNYEITSFGCFENSFFFILSFRFRCPSREIALRSFIRKVLYFIRDYFFLSLYLSYKSSADGFGQLRTLRAVWMDDLERFLGLPCFRMGSAVDWECDGRVNWSMIWGFRFSLVDEQWLT